MLPSNNICNDVHLCKLLSLILLQTRQDKRPAPVDDAYDAPWPRVAIARADVRVAIDLDLEIAIDVWCSCCAVWISTSVSNKVPKIKRSQCFEVFCAPILHVTPICFHSHTCAPVACVLLVSLHQPALYPPFG